MTAAGATIGKSLLYQIDEPACYAGYLVRLRAHSEVDVRFVSYWTESKPYWAQIEAGKVVSTIENFSASKYQNLELLVPPLRQQRAIADFLDAETARIDALFAKKSQLSKLLEERWLIAVSTATPSVKPGQAAPALRRAVDSVIGGSWGDEPGRGEVNAFCVRGTDFDTRGLSVDIGSAPLRSFSSGEFRSRRLEGGDLIVEKSGGGETQPVGRVVQWSGDQAAVPTNFAARIRPGTSADSRYLAYVFRAAYEGGVTRTWIKQTTGIQNLDLGGLLSERWCLPNRETQERLATQLDAASALVQSVQGRLNRQIMLLQERRQALITAAVTGELDIPGMAA